MQPHCFVGLAQQAARTNTRTCMCFPPFPPKPIKSNCSSKHASNLTAHAQCNKTMTHWFPADLQPRSSVSPFTQPGPFTAGLNPHAWYKHVRLHAQQCHPLGLTCSCHGMRRLGSNVHSSYALEWDLLGGSPAI